MRVAFPARSRGVRGLSVLKRRGRTWGGRAIPGEGCARGSVASLKEAPKQSCFVCMKYAAAERTCVGGDYNYFPISALYHLQIQQACLKLLANLNSVASIL